MGAAQPLRCARCLAVALGTNERLQTATTVPFITTTSHHNLLHCTPFLQVGIRRVVISSPAVKISRRFPRNRALWATCLDHLNAPTASRIIDYLLRSPTGAGVTDLVATHIGLKGQTRNNRVIKRYKYAIQKSRYDKRKRDGRDKNTITEPHTVRLHINQTQSTGRRERRKRGSSCTKKV